MWETNFKSDFVNAGLQPKNMELKIEDLKDVRQLDALARAFVLMGRVSGQTSPEFLPLCLLAHRCCVALWKVSGNQQFPCDEIVLNVVTLHVQDVAQLITRISDFTR